MSSLGEILSSALQSLGWPGLILAIFLIFMVDAAIFPALPEIFIVAFYVQYGALGLEPFTWGVALLLTAMAGELCGNGIIYTVFSRFLVKKKRMPRLLDKAIKGWANFLIVKNENVVLMNRFAPAVPFIGAFIAVCNWNVRKSFAYILLGSIIKYSILLAIVGYLNIAYDPQIAQWLTLAAVVIIIVLSIAASFVRRRRLRRVMPQGEKA